MDGIGTLERQGDVAIITINSPPVNALGIDVRLALMRLFNQAEADPSISAIVLACGGRTFFAGADINEVGSMVSGPNVKEVINVIEGGTKPSVAAIHGTALGGGLEVALACSYRIAIPSATVGLPEVKLGLLPGAGGTQRLPRVVGLEVALELITSGRRVNAPEAYEMGILDALVREEQLLHDAIAFARHAIGKPTLRVRDRGERIAAARGDAHFFADFRHRNAAALRGSRALENVIKAAEAAVNLPFDEGLAEEARLLAELRNSVESRAKIHLFFAERAAAKVPDIPASVAALPINRVGVVGAGTMGGGIAMNFLNAGIPVRLADRTQGALDRGIATIRHNYENSARKGRITSEQVEQRMGLIVPELSMEAFANVDLAIEAVFEEIGIKKAIFADLDRITGPGAILASNTSFLDLDQIAAATSRPERVVGLHFFSPANVMRLLEVVRGRATSHQVMTTTLNLAKRIGKVPVVSGVCEGFIANRVMARRADQADAVILEGSTPQEVDRALEDYGFAMGHFRMMDLVGLDVLGRGDTQRSVAGDLVAHGRLGQKNNGGYYDYDQRRLATPSPVAAEIIARVARHLGNVDGGKPSSGLLARMLYPVVNEGAKLLEEGIALRASDIDVACTLGYNWPVNTGGPMFWADTVGLDVIVATLKKLEAEHGPAFKPCSLLVRIATEGGKLSEA